MHLENPFCILLYSGSDEPNELRYFDAPPRPGQRIRSRSGAIWTATDVVQSGVNTYTVFCAPPSERVMDLAADLLDQARKSISPREIRRRRHQRHYLP